MIPDSTEAEPELPVAGSLTGASQSASASRKPPGVPAGEASPGSAGEAGPLPSDHAASGKLLLVLTMVDSRDQADSIARTLVEERLAACVNILAGCNSVYRWQGAVEHAQETMLLIKTTRERYARFEQRLLALHPYDLPEIVALAPEAVLPAYAQWVIDETAESLA